MLERYYPFYSKGVEVPAEQSCDSIQSNQGGLRHLSSRDGTLAVRAPNPNTGPPGTSQGLFLP